MKIDPIQRLEDYEEVTGNLSNVESRLDGVLITLQYTRAILVPKVSDDLLARLHQSIGKQVGLLSVNDLCRLRVISE